ncbi:MAG: hypothetical protein ACI4HQ_11050 [Acetatifactor sp.]
MKYVELAKANVSQDVLDKFDCGHPDFNDFLAEEAIECANSGNGVTYILIDEAEETTGITVVFAFCTLKATALYYSKADSDSLFSVSCAEIKYFAIAKAFQKIRTGKLGVGKYYSTMFFEILLADLYEMSTAVIGFTGIFLRANENGEKLYRRKKFVDATEFMIPYEEDDELGKCTPMYLSISDNIYSIFGEE